MSGAGVGCLKLWGVGLCCSTDDDRRVARRLARDQFKRCANCAQQPTADEIQAKY